MGIILASASVSSVLNVDKVMELKVWSITRYSYWYVPIFGMATPPTDTKPARVLGDTNTMHKRTLVAEQQERERARDTDDQRTEWSRVWGIHTHLTKLTSFSDLGVGGWQSPDFAADIVGLVGRNEVLYGQMFGSRVMIAHDEPHHLTNVAVDSRHTGSARDRMGQRELEGKVRVRGDVATIDINAHRVSKTGFRMTAQLSHH